MRGNDWISLPMIAGARPAASIFAHAAFGPRNAKSVKISRPPGTRCRGAPAITRSSSCQPSAPPLSATAAAASTAATPSPPPISSTRSPGRTARWRQRKSEPALGAWTRSGTRNRQPRQENRRVPASLLAKDAPEVESERFLQLRPGSGGCLRVFELIDVDLERDPLALDAVELGGEPAPLVRLGEDQLR